MADEEAEFFGSDDEGSDDLYAASGDELAEENVDTANESDNAENDSHNDDEGDYGDDSYDDFSDSYGEEEDAAAVHHHTREEHVKHHAQMEAKKGDENDHDDSDNSKKNPSSETKQAVAKHQRTLSLGPKEWRLHPQRNEGCCKSDFVHDFGEEAIAKWLEAELMRPDEHGILLTRENFIEEHGPQDGAALWDAAPTLFDPQLESIQREGESTTPTKEGANPSNDVGEKSVAERDLEKDPNSTFDPDASIFDEVDAKEQAFLDKFKNKNVEEVAEAQRLAEEQKAAEEAAQAEEQKLKQEQEMPDEVDEDEGDDNGHNSYDDDEFDDEDDDHASKEEVAAAVHRQQEDEEEAQRLLERKEKEKREREEKEAAEAAARAKQEEEALAREKEQEELRAKAEAEARAKAEEEARVKAEEDARAQAEKEAKAKEQAEEEARIQAEEAARKKAEDEAKAAEEAERRRIKEEKAKQDAERQAAEDAERREEQERQRAAIEEAEKEEEALNAQLQDIHTQIDAILEQAEETSSANTQQEINALSANLKEVTQTENKLAAELRNLQEKNTLLQKQIQNLPENSDDPKTLRDRNHYLDSVLRPLAAENGSLLNVEKLQTTAFTAVELEANAYRVEVDKLKSKIVELKDEINASKEAQVSRSKLKRQEKIKSVHRELRRIQEENNFLSTNLRLLRENLKGYGPPVRGPRAAKHKRAIADSKKHRRHHTSNNGTDGSGSDSDDSYGSDGFNSDDDGHSDSKSNGAVALSPSARQRAMSILDARLHSAENKRSPMRGRYGPRQRKGRARVTHGPPGRGGPTPAHPGPNSVSIEQKEDSLLRKKASLQEAFRVFDQRASKKLSKYAAERFNLDDQLSQIRGQLQAVQESSKVAEEKRFKLIALIQQLKQAMEAKTTDDEPETSSLTWQEVQEREMLAQAKARERAEAEAAKQQAIEQAKAARLAKTGRDADIFSLARARVNAAAYAMGGVDLERLFKRIDVDNSGCLDNGEFFHVIRHMLRLSPAEIPDDTIQDLFDHIDIADGSKEGGDGQISLDELRRFMTEEGFDEYSASQKEWVEQERAEEREVKRLAARRAAQKKKQEQEQARQAQQSKQPSKKSSQKPQKEEPGVQNHDEEQKSENHTPQKTQAEMDADRRAAEEEAIQRQKEITAARRRQERAAAEARKADEEQRQQERQKRKEAAAAKAKAAKEAKEAEESKQAAEAQQAEEARYGEDADQAAEIPADADASKQSNTDDPSAASQDQQSSPFEPEKQAQDSDPNNTQGEDNDGQEDDHSYGSGDFQEESDDEALATTKVRQEEEEEDVDFDPKDPRQAMKRRVKLRNAESQNKDVEEK